MPEVAAATSLAAARRQVAEVNWFHRIDLRNGIVAPGDDDTQEKLRQLAFPERMLGKSFLDICAWDGFFSFEAERRGASPVLAVDSYVWEGKVPEKSKAGFLLARSILESKVIDLNLDPTQVSPELAGVFDIVLLSGVLYHVRHPWLLIERAASVTRELLIIETFIDLRFKRRPAIAIYPSEAVEKDHSENWCGPNVAALRGMLHSCGFRDVKVVYKSSVVHGLLSAARRLLKFGYSPLKAIQQGRCVIHARR